MTTKMIMPWDARAAELEFVHGPYCQYAAWEEWMEQYKEIDLSEVDKVFLFAAMEAACADSVRLTLAHIADAGKKGGTDSA